MADRPVKVPGPGHPITIEANSSRVVVTVGGKVIADTSDALTLREASYPPDQYIPRRDVNMVFASMFALAYAASLATYSIAHALGAG